MKKYNLKEYIEVLEKENQIINKETYEDFLVDNVSYNSQEVINNTLFVCKEQVLKKNI